jgi:hypothetical protein
MKSAEATTWRCFPGRVPVSEAVVLAMVCLAPWAFGSVEARAHLGLALGIALLAILNVASGWRAPRTSRPFNINILPALALAGLALWAWAQAVALPEGV